MTKSDLPAADELRCLAGWNQTLEDWTRLLAFEPQGCFVAKLDDQIKGSVTTTVYGQTLAWIGMMLVHPDCRRQGIGTALMKKALEHLYAQKVACIKLDATPAGLPLYAQLGFVSEWTLTRWQVPPESRTLLSTESSDQTRSLSEADWPSIELFDAAVLGVSRLPLLRSLSRNTLASRVWLTEGRVAGLGMLRPGARAEYLGPLVCSNPKGGLALVRDLLADRPSTAAFWDIPDQNETARHLAKRLGFQPVRPLTRMRLGADSRLGSPHAQLGIADPAVG